VRAVVQRVSRAAVTVDGRVTGAIDRGLLALVGVAVDDGERDAVIIGEKIAGLRIFPDAGGLMNRSVVETGGAVLVVSQFTLLGDVRKGRRPSFISAARETLARELYERTGAVIAAQGISVQYGEFGAHMDVELVNDGPVTILLDSKRAF
jgi:D-tyrosyl-tRNA(Tyr) deacylase